MGTIAAKQFWFGILGAVFLYASDAHGQNDWQSPDPYFGAFQHRQAGTPEAERRYRAEIAPQQPHRLHEHPTTPGPLRKRWFKPRSRAGSATRP